MWGSLVSQVGSTGTLAPKVAGGERLDTAYHPGFNDCVACAPRIRFLPRGSGFAGPLRAVSCAQAVFVSEPDDAPTLTAIQQSTDCFHCSIHWLGA
jgi:hypothetical protein